MPVRYNDKHIQSLTGEEHDEGEKTGNDNQAENKVIQYYDGTDSNCGDSHDQ